MYFWWIRYDIKSYCKTVAPLMTYQLTLMLIISTLQNYCTVFWIAYLKKIFFIHPSLNELLFRMNSNLNSIILSNWSSVSLGVNKFFFIHPGLNVLLFRFELASPVPFPTTTVTLGAITHTLKNTHTHTHTHIYIYIFFCTILIFQ